jgi:hypothetical protein
MICSKKIESHFFLIERKRYYNFLEGERCKGLSDTEMIEFGILCASHSVKTEDWRFVNLALKILDSEVVLTNKVALENEIAASLKELQNQIL